MIRISLKEMLFKMKYIIRVNEMWLYDLRTSKSDNSDLMKISKRSTFSEVLLRVSEVKDETED
jgi:hypothetical protein